GGGPNNSIATTIPGPLTAEMWNPTTETFSRLATAQEPRMYHHTALLLPDGRVLVAGGGKDPDGIAVNYQDAEIYSPPYLFKGPRPTISSAPSSTAYGSNFTIQTPNAASIGSVTLIGLGAQTHTWDMQAHYVPLTFTAGSGTLNVQAPTSANIAPPGYY